VRALVTGGAGFIGSHLTRKLLAQGAQVTVVDNLSTGRRDNLPREHPNLRFIHARLSAALPALDMSEFDECYHLAATVGVELVVRDPIASIENNVGQTASLLDALTPHRVPTLIASSSEVYGKRICEAFRETDDSLLGPTTAFRWSYACSKALDEHLALAHHAHHGLPAVVVRLFNTVGPGQVGDYGMVVPRFVRAALANEPIRVFGTGEQSRCFCDVRDVVEALINLLRCAPARGRVFNVGSDRAISINALAELVRTELESSSEIAHTPYAQAYGPGFEDLAQRRPDLTRIREAIGFTPRIELRQTVRDIAQHITTATARGGHAREDTSPCPR
jgi:UDP-glucose 4-epimerase